MEKNYLYTYKKMLNFIYKEIQIKMSRRSCFSPNYVVNPPPKDLK